MKDLGMIIDSDLSFCSHIEDKLKKANTVLGIIRRSFTCLTPSILIPLYKAFVRHLIEYGAVVWCARLTRAQTRAIEKIQMRATEMVEGIGHLDYPDRLRALDLPTLAYRRARGQMIEVWKHINTYDPDIITQTFQYSASARRA